MTCQVLIYIAPRTAQSTIGLMMKQAIHTCTWAVSLLTPQRLPGEATVAGTLLAKARASLTIASVY